MHLCSVAPKAVNALETLKAGRPSEQTSALRVLLQMLMQRVIKRIVERTESQLALSNICGSKKVQVRHWKLKAPEVLIQLCVCGENSGCEGKAK